MLVCCNHQCQHRKFLAIKHIYESVSEKSEMLRHFLASIAYHATKATRDAPDHYTELDIGKGVRTFRMILHHITGVLSYAHSFYEH